ncbi:MAG: hypothetical protein GTN78_21900 [Gemmatimonadales bacterium]|nr:hypothetical protein [Gemmatimonadales bacterium]NIN10582.1 hypothetical protein [Gemmatimonadales bacterium]NIR02822.1 hypothetical protein [Gemmatimonadales bacterium]NIS66414.1 hypothetical protein [Gemmatimonadales bacterium]
MTLVTGLLRACDEGHLTPGIQDVCCTVHPVLKGPRLTRPHLERRREWNVSLLGHASSLDVAPAEVPDGLVAEGHGQFSSLPCDVAAHFVPPTAPK